MNARHSLRWVRVAALFAVVAVSACGDGGGGKQLLGPAAEQAASPNGLAKFAVQRVSAHRAAVSVTVTHADGTPASGLEVAFSRSISGQALDYNWKGMTDADGRAEIEITADSPQFWRTGASGYYAARAVDPASDEVLGRWGSIPVNAREKTVLTLPIGGRAHIHPYGPRLTVMTRNIYLGADINRILQPADPETPIPVLAAQTWGMIQQTDFPGRAKAIADEIAAARPHLVGLQEVSLYRIQNPGDFLAGNPIPATEVAMDFLAILLNELEARGQSYHAVAVSEGVDIELPMFTGQTTPMADIRMTDREVILARSGVHTDNVREAQFQAGVPVNLGGVSMTIPRAWASVEATVAGRTVRFVSAHLETGAAEPIQRLQGGELLREIGTGALPTILVGDFNSAADGSTTGTYGDLTGAGLVDVWDLANPGEDGYTGSQKEDLLNDPSALRRRVDLIFLRGTDDLTVLGANVVGENPADRIPSGLWPSDHAGVVASLRLPRR